MKKSSQLPVSGQPDQRTPTEQSGIEESVNYDFNDSNLVELILIENDALLTGKVEPKQSAVRKTLSQTQDHSTKEHHYNSELNRQEILKNITRSTTGDRNPTLSEYNAQPTRTTHLPDTIITRHPTLINENENIKKSSPYSATPYTSTNITTTSYVTRNEYSNQPNPRFVQGRTEYEIPKSNLPPVEHAKNDGFRPGTNQGAYASTIGTSQTPSDRPIEEWQPNKYPRRKIQEEEEEELEGGFDFCGLCVSTRKKEKTNKA